MINNDEQICILESKSIPKKTEKMKKAHSCFHRMLFYEDFLEWKESTGSTTNLVKFQIVEEKNTSNILYDDVPKFLNDFDSNKIQIISASPGMGKSVLLNYIKCSATSSAWILPIVLRSIAKIKHQPSEFFTFYINQFLSKDASVQNMELSLMVYQDMLNSKKVLLLLDGFDEITISHKDKFSNLIEYFHKEKFPVLITTRENMKIFLEKKFNVLSKNLKPFTLDEQRQFLEKYFKLSVMPDDISNGILSEFVEQLLKSAKFNLTDRDEAFTGVPLQLQLLAEYFLKEFKKSIETGKVFLTAKFDLLDLYDNFITNKTSILCEKHGDNEEGWLKSLKSNQQLFALKYLFDDRHLKNPNIKNCLQKYYEEEEHDAQLIQKDGILIARPTEDKISIDFIHLTFAEYLAAQWLTKNVTNSNFKETVAVLVKLRFEEQDNYTFLFAMFDRILAKQCPIHLDIINIKVDDIKKKIESDPNIFATSDAINRTAFHIFGLYANDYKEEDLIEILDIKQIINNNLDTLDNITRYSALDYALFTSSWTFANILCEFSQYLAIQHYNISYVPIEQLSLKYKYLYLTIFHNHLCRDMLIGDVKEDTQILDYVKELSYNLWLSKDVFDFVKSVSTLGEHLKLCGIKDATKYYYNDIRFAVAFGAIENIKNLLSINKININERDTSNGHTLLHYATIYKRSDVVKMLLSKGADVNIAGRNGSTVVHEAARSGNIDVLEMCIAAENANLSPTNFSMETPFDIALRFKHANLVNILIRYNAKIPCSKFQNDVLHDVVKLGDLELLREFLKKDFDINKTYFNGTSPLHTALQNNRIDMAKILINHNCDLKSDTASDSLTHLIAKLGNVELLNIFLKDGVNIDKPNKIGETPLMIAIDNDHVEFAKILICNNADVLAKCKYGDVFTIAISNGNEEIISLLIDRGCNVNRIDDRGKTPLLKALQEKKLNIVELFLQNGAEINMKNNFGYTTLHYAAMYGYKDLVVQFLGCGININKTTHDTNSTALLLALEYRQLDVAKLLISSKAEVNVVNKNKCNTLHYAVMYGDIIMVQDLIAAGEEFNLQNDIGTTPLQLAVSNNKPDIIQLLLSYDVDITLKTYDGRSTLHIAASAGNNDMIRICLENHFEINEKNALGRTPLLFALQQKKFETAILLIQNGADIHVKDKFLNSALHYAAEVGHDDFVRTFLEEGLDINEKNSHSQTPLSLALKNCYLSTAQLLHTNGAEIGIKMLDRSTTLHLAASCGYNELIIECIHKGYDINIANFDCDLPIDFAILENKYETVKLLIERGTIPSMHTLKLFIDMKVQSDFEVEERIKYFKLLLDNFSNINLNDKEGNTILHYLCNSDYIKNNENNCGNFYTVAVKLLLDLDANFEFKNKNRTSAYDLAVENNLEIILKIFDQNIAKRMD